MLLRRFSTLSMALAGVAMLSGCTWNPIGVSDPKPEGEVVSAPEPRSPTEQVLARMGDLPSGEVLTLPGGLSATASVPYSSASGRRCRHVALRGDQAGSDESRLACAGSGEPWTWYPSVLP